MRCCLEFTLSELIVAGRSPMEHVVGEESLQCVLERSESAVVWSQNTSVILPQLLQNP